MRVRSMTSALVRRSIPLIASFIAFASVAQAAEPVPLSPPAKTALPTGPLGDSIRYGQSLVTNTRALPGFVGNGLTCANCHLDAGRVAYAAPLAGLWGVFPEYRARRGGVESLTERIDDCFERSMNGKPLPSDSREMIALLSYIAWLSEGVPTGVEVQGRGFKEITAPSPPNAIRGEALYVAKCAACHGADGEGLRARSQHVFEHSGGAAQIVLDPLLDVARDAPVHDPERGDRQRHERQDREGHDLPAQAEPHCG